MRKMPGLGLSRWGWEGPREGRRKAVHGHVVPAPHRSHMLKPSSVLSSCCWVGSSLAKPSPSAPAAFQQCFDSFPFLPSHPGTVHSAKNILEDISNMFDDLADQLDAMLD